MRKLLLSVVALFALSAQNAFAINLTFQFDVNSSGPSIYACNAGIKHGNGDANICYDRVTNLECSAGCAAGNMNACQKKDSKGKITYQEPKNCVCTGEYDTTGNQGTYRMDFLQANTANWEDNQTAATNGITPYILTADGVSKGSKFNQIFGTDTGATEWTVPASYKNQIRDMTINLGSEIYGAEYFVDICYRGPQIDYTHNGRTVTGLNFNLKAFATIFDIRQADGQSYNTLAGLQVKAEAKCIVEDNFDYCLADVLPGDSSGCGQVAPVTHNYTFGTGFNSINNGVNVSKLINETTIAANGNKTPRFCQIRYSFKETAGKTMRKWKLQQARICTYTEITEPSN